MLASMFGVRAMVLSFWTKMDMGMRWCGEWVDECPRELIELSSSAAFEISDLSEHKFSMLYVLSFGLSG